MSAQVALARAICTASCVVIQASSPAQTDTALQARRWTILPDPILSIGEESGDEAYLFKTITGARLLPDGRIAVADAGLLEVRLFGRTGVFLKRLGRSGEGPGEFKDLNAIWVTSNGRIAVWDSGLQRITIYNSEGELTNTQAIHAPEAGGSLDFFAGTYTNDDVVLASLAFRRPPAGQPQAIPDRVVLTRFSLEGSFKGALGEADGIWRFQRRAIAFSAVPWVVVSRDQVFIADGYEAEIESRDARGATARVSFPRVKQPAPDAAWSSLESRLQEQRKTLFLQYLRSIPKDKRIPQIAGLIADDSGGIWAKDYDPLQDSIWLKGNAVWPQPGGQWRVIGPDGRIMATVEIPAGLRPMEIRGELLVGVSTDELDVERVVIHRIRR